MIKLQTRPLIREGTPQNEDRKRPTVIKNLGLTPRQTGRQSQNNLNLNLIRQILVFVQLVTYCKHQSGLSIGNEHEDIGV
jgi:hypothetical protein